MAELTTPELVLGLFHKLRTDVLSVIADGERFANELTAVKDAALKEFAFARYMVADERLSVVIVGAEGAGKSTLIRGILHQELSPIEGNKPGTVAPVYLRYGNGSGPVFTVEFLDDRPPATCSKDECFDYIRQRTNKDNEKRVARAIVEMNNPLLAHGLELVDMPGTGGVSDRVRIEAQSFIRKSAATVVGVADKRAYGPLITIARDMIARDNRASFHAIVSNPPSDWFESEPDEDGHRHPIENDAVERAIRTARVDGMEAISEALEQVGLEDKPTDDDIFVFSANLFFGRKGAIATPAHLAEMDRFLDKIARYVQENSLGIAVQRAARLAETALSRLSSHIGIRGDILSRLLAGDRGLLRIFKEDTKAALLTYWTGEAYNGDQIKSKAQGAWTEFETILAMHRAETVRRVDRLISEVRRLPADTSTQIIRDKVAALRNENFEQIDRDNLALQSILGHIAAAWTVSANMVLNKALAQLPMFKSHTAVAIDLTSNDVLRQAIGDIDDGSKRVMVKTLGTASGAAAGAGLGAKGAVLLTVPEPITMSIGALLCGVAAFTALNYGLNRVFGNAQDVAIKELEKMRSALVETSTKEHDMIRHYVIMAVGQIGILVDRALISRIDQLEALMKDPGREQGRLEGELRDFAAMHQQVREFELRLLAVRNEALQIAEQKMVA